MEMMHVRENCLCWGRNRSPLFSFFPEQLPWLALEQN